MTVSNLIKNFEIGQQVEVCTSQGGRGVVVAVGRKLVSVKQGTSVEQFAPKDLRRLRARSSDGIYPDHAR